MRKLSLGLIIALVFIFGFFQISLEAQNLKTENNYKLKKSIDEKLKNMKKDFTYNDKIESYNNNKANAFLGEWHLISNDSAPNVLIIKKIGDTFHAEFFGVNHWKGIGYFFNGKLLIAFKYTNEVDAGYATYELKKNTKLMYVSINSDSSLRCKGEFVRKN